MDQIEYVIYSKQLDRAKVVALAKTSKLEEAVKLVGYLNEIAKDGVHYSFSDHLKNIPCLT